MVWDPATYLQFGDQRLRPAKDLLARVPLRAPRTVVDLGCGTGNTTRLLNERWADADILGVDRSAAMLAEAARVTLAGARIRWEQSDIAQWRPALPVDLLFSNAALHWLDDHAQLLPALLGAVAPEGVLAVQMPDNFASPAFVALYETVTSARWRELLGSRLRWNPVASAVCYREWLADRAQALDIWTTEYLQLLPAGEGREHPVVAWSRGTALIPYLDALPADAADAFVADYRRRIEVAYPRLSDGSVLYPFKRIFIVAVRAIAAGA